MARKKSRTGRVSLTTSVMKIMIGKSASPGAWKQSFPTARLRCFLTDPNRLKGPSYSRVCLTPNSSSKMGIQGVDAMRGPLYDTGASLTR